MIAADTSSWIAFLQGERGSDTDMLDRALADKLVIMAPVVLTELLSDPKLDSVIGRTLAAVPLLEIQSVPGACEPPAGGGPCGGEKRGREMR